ncbi:hypothetical protein RF11_14564 [Thelohanellus kitauei]|uniref:Uncharacterized protein n=1 Tax=Thelohanellus kitauei TaxID=669202 RepID=A0A0C2IIJ9_THEKT|nr:hypothetical protein RF11_14564 [Thelohanellus kitauei]
MEVQAEDEVMHHHLQEVQRVEKAMEVQVEERVVHLRHQRCLGVEIFILHLHRKGTAPQQFTQAKQQALLAPGNRTRRQRQTCLVVKLTRQPRRACLVLERPTLLRQHKCLGQEQFTPPLRPTCRGEEKLIPQHRRKCQDLGQFIQQLQLTCLEPQKLRRLQRHKYRGLVDQFLQSVFIVMMQGNID